MKVIVAKNAGFCSGVKRAVEIVEARLQSGNLHTLGELIHNPVVVEDLARRGAKVVEDVSALQAGDVLVIRSHGAPPAAFEEAAQRGVEVIDATCSFVKRIHGIVAEAAAKGQQVVVVGDAHHHEVQGIVGWAQGAATVCATPEEAAALQVDGPVCLVAQTTIERQRFDACAAALIGRGIDVEIHDTICDTTYSRQREARQIAREADCMLVVGGQNSSNTHKLYEICAEECPNTRHIERWNDSMLEKISSSGIIGIVAGASTPQWMIMEVVTAMTEQTLPSADQEANINTEPQAPATEAQPEVETPVQAEQNESAAEAPAEETAKQEVSAEAADDAESAQTDQQGFEDMLTNSVVSIRNGQIITGTVVQITDDEVCVNIGYKSDGIIPKKDFSTEGDVDLHEAVKVGDEIEVEVVKVNDGEGNVALSRRSVEARLAWDKFIAEAEEEGRVFEAEGKEAVKGGLIAFIEGVRAFIPASHLSTKYVEKISDFVGQPLRLKVIDIDKNKRRIVASQKAVLMEEQESKKKELWDQLVEGSKVKGIVRRLSDFGAFVDIGGIDGLVHVTELAWSRVKHPSDILKVGDEIEVVILNVDKERERVSLGYKQLQAKPWASAEERYPVGSVVEGRVARIVPFGAFISLEPTIDGLVHISQVSTHRIDKVEDELKVGDVITVKVIDVNSEAKRISLSRRAVLMDEMPPEEQEEREREREKDKPAAEDRPRRESPDKVVIPPVEHSTVTLGDLFPDMDAGDDE